MKALTDHERRIVDRLGVMPRRRQHEQALFDRYLRIYGKKPDLANPRLFSEKLYRQMLTVSGTTLARMTRLSDKLLVREYVRQRIGARILVPVLWCGSSPRRIPFERLPEKYILKVNHGSGGNIVVDGAPKREEITHRLSQWLRTNYYWEDREFQYFGIKPRILAEMFLDDGSASGPLDYRFWCFNGKPRMIQVDNASHSINPFYDLDWNKLDLTYRPRFDDFDAKAPSELPGMLEIATTLAGDFEFVRVDLYCVAGRVYFGEMTFTPVGGRLNFSPGEWDERLGTWWSKRS